MVLGGVAAAAASLGYCAWVYGVRFGIAGSLAVNTGLFGLFAAHHSVLARSGVRRRVAGLLPDGLERAAYIWAAAILLALACAWWQPLPGTLYRLEGVFRGIGHVLQAAGAVLFVRGAAVLDLAELAGIRQSAAGGREDARAPAELRVRGPYRRLRHPLYAGLLLALLGTPDMTLDRAWFAALATAYIVIGIAWEERDMAARFGARYDRYRAEVRWRLVPGIY